MSFKINKNKVVQEYLDSNGWNNSEEIVADLINGGFIEPDPITEPERIVQAAKGWLGSKTKEDPKQVFEYASGWTTASWEHVLDEKFEEENPFKSRDIFKALVILAKEAGKL